MLERSLSSVLIALDAHISQGDLCSLLGVDADTLHQMLPEPLVERGEVLVSKDYPGAVCVVRSSQWRLGEICDFHYLSDGAC